MGCPMRTEDVEKGVSVIDGQGQEGVIIDDSTYLRNGEDYAVVTMAGTPTTRPVKDLRLKDTLPAVGYVQSDHPSSPVEYHIRPLQPGDVSQLSEAVMHAPVPGVVPVPTYGLEVHDKQPWAGPGPFGGWYGSPPPRFAPSTAEPFTVPPTTVPGNPADWPHDPPVHRNEGIPLAYIVDLIADTLSKHLRPYEIALLKDAVDLQLTMKEILDNRFFVEGGHAGRTVSIDRIYWREEMSPNRYRIAMQQVIGETTSIYETAGGQLFRKENENKTWWRTKNGAMAFLGKKTEVLS